MSATGTLHTQKQVADRRAKAPHASMFARMLLRAAVLRRRRAAAALLAMIVAAAVATAMMNLYVDVQAKLRTEFRNYVANVVSPNRQPFELTFQDKSIELIPAGMLQTGAGEDSRIYLDQSEFQNWTGVTPSTIEVAANGAAADVEAAVHQLAQSLPEVEIRPVRQIMEGEANVLNKTRATLYASATLVVLTSALCVLATLIGWVFDRRRDFAIMK